MMETGLLGWADLVMETIQIVALGAILWRLKHLHREITALVRVVRRMDRKTPEKKTGVFLAGAEARGAGMQRLLPERPTPERCVEAYYLQRTRFESIAERKLRPTAVTEDGNVEISGRDLQERTSSRRGLVWR